MALITSGAMIGQISGKLGPVVFSHNRGGPYVRAHVVPVTSTTSFALNAKARLSAASQLWQTLTAAQKDAWATWANNNPITNRIGARVTLSGHGAFTGLTSSLAQAGVAAVLDPPVVPAPAGLLTLSGTYDIGAGAVEIAWTTTPTAADIGLYVQTAIVNSTGINFIRPLLKLISITTGATASPFDVESSILARFGTLLVGQQCVHEVSTFDRTNGQRSQPLRTEGVFITT